MPKLAKKVKPEETFKPGDVAVIDPDVENKPGVLNKLLTRLKCTPVDLQKGLVVRNVEGENLYLEPPHDAGTIITPRRCFTRVQAGG